MTNRQTDSGSPVQTDTALSLPIKFTAGPTSNADLPLFTLATIQVHILLMFHDVLAKHLNCGPSSKKFAATLDFLCLSLCHQHSALDAVIVAGEIYGGRDEHLFPISFMERNDNIIAMLKEPLTPASVAVLKAEIEEARKSWEAWIAASEQCMSRNTIVAEQ
ncbi:MAG: hypothetical protein HQM09_24820 [Candidatus Riflebacteria bacterium]|nr:hypothetical protein [Candidatus Riflebacteria bacterium]